MLKQIWTQSWTSAWGWTKVAAGSLLTGVHFMGTLVSNADVKSALGPLNLDPKVTLALTLLGVITLMSVEHADSNPQSS